MMPIAKPIKIAEIIALILILNHRIVSGIRFFIEGFEPKNKKKCQINKLKMHKKSQFRNAMQNNTIFVCVAHWNIESNSVLITIPQNAKP